MSSFSESVYNGGTKIPLQVNPIGYYSHHSSKNELGRDKGEAIAKPLKRKTMAPSGDEPRRKKPKKRVKYTPPTDNNYL